MSEENGFTDADRHQVVQSLESIVRIVLSKELVALRDSIADIDSRLSERVGSAEATTTSRIDQMRDQLVPGFEELRSRLNEVAENREKSLASLDDRLAQATSSMRDELRRLSDDLEEPKKEVASLREQLDTSRLEIEVLREELSESKQANTALKESSDRAEADIVALREELARPKEQIEALKQSFEEPKKQLDSIREELQALTERLQEVAEQSDNHIEVVKATLEQEIAGGDARLMEQLNGIVGEFNELQNQMTRQTQTSQHLSGVLNNLASIFTSKRDESVSASRAGDLDPSGGGAPKEQAEVASAPTKSEPDRVGSRSEGGNPELENALNRVFPLDS